MKPHAPDPEQLTEEEIRVYIIVGIAHERGIRDDGKLEVFSTDPLMLFRYEPSRIYRWHLSIYMPTDNIKATQELHNSYERKLSRREMLAKQAYLLYWVKMRALSFPDDSGKPIRIP